MDPQTSNVPIAEAQNPETSRPPKGYNGITVASMAIFVLLSLTTVVFLYYQNQKLKNMLADYLQVQTTPAPTPTATADPTADWIVYTDIKGRYSFKYPSDWTTSKNVGSLNDPAMKFILGVQAKNTTLNVQDWTKANICTKFSTVNDQNGCTPYTKSPIENSIQTTFLAHYGGMHTIFKYEDTIFDISLAAREPNPNFEEIKNVYNQILSTFKFIGNEKPVESGISCQYNGKIYKNGESVPSGDKCNTCSCDNGQIACTLMACP